jgi:hypothetical protein
MNPEAMFHGLCAQPSLTEAVKGLNEFDLSRLIRWLRAGHGRGVHGLVLGLCELQAADRFVSAHTHPIL